MNELMTIIKKISEQNLDETALKTEFDKLPYSLNEINLSIKKVFEEKRIAMKQKHLKILFSEMPEEIMPEIYNSSQIYGLPLKSGVYFILNKKSGLVKIGCAIDIESRFKQIKTAFHHVGMPCDLKLLGIVLVYPKYLKKVESDFHKTFSNYREIGEWFKISYDDIFSEHFCDYDTGNVFFGKDYFVDYNEYEFYHFPKISKTYEFAQNPLGVFLFDSKKENKLQNIIDSVERNKVGFYAIYFDYPKEELHKIGIKYPETEETVNFQDIKTKKAMERDWDDFFTKINA